MRIQRATAAIGATVLFVTGAAVAARAASDPDTVRLCLNVKTGSVSTALSTGACAKGTTTVDLASAQAVAGLKSLAAQQTQQINDLKAVTLDLQGQLDALQPPSLSGTAEVDYEQSIAIVRISGSGLMPGTLVYKSERYEDFAPMDPPVGEDGRFSAEFTLDCRRFPVYFQGTTKGNETIGGDVRANC